MDVQNLLNFFRPGQQGQAAPAVPVTNPPNPQLNIAAGQGTAGTPPAPVVTPPGNTPGTASAGDPSLDAFSKLWDTKPSEQAGIPKFATDTAKLQEAASKIQFTNAIPPELMQKALSGDAQSFQQVLNTVAQTVFAQAAAVTTKLMDTGLEATSGHLTNQLPEHIRKQLTNNELVGENPLFAHPAAKPILDSIQSQMAALYPQATPSELASKAKEYLTSFIAMANGKQVEDTSKPSQTGKPTDDWSTFGLPNS